MRLIGYVGRRARRSATLLALAIACVSLPAHVSTAVAADAAIVDSDAEWLTTVNDFRAMSQQAPVVEDPMWSAAAANHSCYMLLNGITHDELPGAPGYTAEGDEAGNNGNVAVSGDVNAPARSHVELWMTGPFHAIGVLRANLRSVGFGTCANESTAPWHSAATLDVLHGLGPRVPLVDPIVFPGAGTTTSLNRFIAESPNPLEFCGWTGSAGLPIIAMMPEDFAGNPAATLTSPAGRPDVCVLSRFNTSERAREILAADNAVVVIPRVELAGDRYSVTVTTSARSVNWSFTVDPTAATAASSAPMTAPLSTGNGLQPVRPTRIVDTRIGLGASPLAAGGVQRVQVAGQGGIPAQARAASANFTITEPQSAGYLTVWNCSAHRPLVSTLNFVAGETVPNGAIVPLDAGGGLCVMSPANGQLLIDVNGYLSAAAEGSFSAIAQARLVDTRSGLGLPGRLAADTTTPLILAGVAGVPRDAELVALNLIAIDAAETGFLTVYPCDQRRPTVSSLNPEPSGIHANLVLAPLAADGSVCLYTRVAVDLVVDITGYVAASGHLRFAAAEPFRLADTREQPQSTATGRIMAIQVAGARGIAADAKAVSANFTVTGGAAPGYLTAWACGPRPATSTLNYVAEAATANASQLTLSASGQLCVYASSDVDVIVDVNGWWS